MTAKKKPQAARITEPAAETAPEPAEQSAESTPSVLEAIHSFLKDLGHDPEETLGVEVGGRYVRVMGKDRSLRTHRIEETK